MDRNVFTHSQHAPANSFRLTSHLTYGARRHSTLKHPGPRHPMMSHLTVPPVVLSHPALAHPEEEFPLDDTLDLSFQHAVHISRVDREIIDQLTEMRDYGRMRVSR